MCSTRVLKIFSRQNFYRPAYNVQETSLNISASFYSHAERTRSCLIQLAAHQRAPNELFLLRAEIAAGNDHLDRCRTSGHEYRTAEAQNSSIQTIRSNNADCMHSSVSVQSLHCERRSISSGHNAPNVMLVFCVALFQNCISSAIDVRMYVSVFSVVYVVCTAHETCVSKVIFSKIYFQRDLFLFKRATRAVFGIQHDLNFFVHSMCSIRNFRTTLPNKTAYTDYSGCTFHNAYFTTRVIHQFS